MQKLLYEDMEIEPYSVKDKLTFPLGLYDSVPIAEAKSKDGDSFVVVAGLDQHMATQVKHYSLSEDDPELQENTSDKKRFGEGSYEEWYEKGRVPFALIHEKSETLTAICWFGPKPLGAKSMKYLTEEERAHEKELGAEAGNWHTISYRSYNPFRGKGHMRGFVQFCIDTYLDAYPEATLWAIFNSQNAGSIALAGKLGFKEVPEGSESDSHLKVMVRG